MSKLCLYLTATGLLSSVQPAVAEAPMLQNSGPIIYLADNLDEPEKLGWCIDTVGRGQSDAVHLHSCKPDSSNGRNRDVLFTFDIETGQIEHAEYTGSCVTLQNGSTQTTLGLSECEAGSQDQSFSFNTENGTFSPSGQPDQCLTAGQNSRQAGPYVSRSLDVLACDLSDPTLRTWAIAEAE